MRYYIYKLKQKFMRFSFLLKINKLVNNIINGRAFNRRVMHLKKSTIFDYSELAKPMLRLYVDYVPENNDKNMSRCLKEE